MEQLGICVFMWCKWLNVYAYIYIYIIVRHSNFSSYMRMYLCMGMHLHKYVYLYVYIYVYMCVRCIRELVDSWREELRNIRAVRKTERAEYRKLYVFISISVYICLCACICYVCAYIFCIEFI